MGKNHHFSNITQWAKITILVTLHSGQKPLEMDHLRIFLNDSKFINFAHCVVEMGMAEKILFCSKWKTIYSRVRCPFPHHHVPPLQHSYIHTEQWHTLKTRCPFE